MASGLDYIIETGERIKNTETPSIDDLNNMVRFISLVEKRYLQRRHNIASDSNN